MISDYLKSDKEEDWIEYIAQSLNGTTNSLNEYLEEYIDKGFSEDKLYEEIDNITFQCTCGWWCDVSEMNDLDGETVCDDCYEEE